jgi:hypothetical protein
MMLEELTKAEQTAECLRKIFALRIRRRKNPVAEIVIFDLISRLPRLKWQSRDSIRHCGKKVRSEMINPYGIYTASGLHSELMQINAGDANELHNALIALCNTITDLSGTVSNLCIQVKDHKNKIAKLEKQLDEVRSQVQPVNAVSQVTLKGK